MCGGFRAVEDEPSHRSQLQVTMGLVKSELTSVKAQVMPAQDLLKAACGPGGTAPTANAAVERLTTDARRQTPDALLTVFPNGTQPFRADPCLWCGSEPP